MFSVRSIMSARRLAMRVFRTHLPSTTRQSRVWSKLPNLINEPSVDWQKARSFSGKSSADWTKVADFSGKWCALEYDDESWVKLFEALGYADARAAVEFYKNNPQREIIDKGGVVIIKLPDPIQGGQREFDLTVGQEWVGKNPMGETMKILATREGNKLTLKYDDHDTIYEFQGEKVLFAKRHHGTGITASVVFGRDNSSL